MSGKSRLVSPLYVANIVIQSFFDFAVPLLLAFLLGRLLIRREIAQGWIFAVTMPIGAAVGFFTMIKFILSSMSALERLEKQKRKDTERKQDNDPSARPES